MEGFGSLFKKQHIGQLVLVVVFIIYIIMGYETPEPVASLIDTMFGKVIVVVVSLSLFAYANPVLGVLGLYVAYDLLRRSTESTGSAALAAYMPSEAKKMNEFTAFNQFPYTLEQEIVKKMTPVNKSGFVENAATFKPLLDDYHDASPLM